MTRRHVMGALGLTALLGGVVAPVGAVTHAAHPVARAHHGGKGDKHHPGDRGDKRHHGRARFKGLVASYTPEVTGAVTGTLVLQETRAMTVSVAVVSRTVITVQRGVGPTLAAGELVHVAAVYDTTTGAYTARDIRILRAHADKSEKLTH